MEFLWQISGERLPLPNPDQGGIVSVSFISEADGTTVTVNHHAWERHGVGAQEYRDGFVEAWPMALARFTQHFDSRV